MKNFLRGVIVGGLIVYVAMALHINAQVEAPIMLRVPPISTDREVWTPDQQMELRKMFNDIVTQNTTIYRSLEGRIRQID